jgi:hypothetical protein
MFSSPLPIPTSFWLYGQKITVRFDPFLSDTTDCVGESRYRINEIVLQPHTEGIARLESKIEQTFLHEVMHFILQNLGEEELRSNEKLIDSMAQLLHQMLTTAHYGREK